MSLSRKAVVYLVSNGHVLTFTQPNVPGAGRQVPSGTIEGTETPVAAGLRELTEESGLVATAASVRYLGDTFIHAPWDDAGAFHHRYFVRIDDDTQPLTPFMHTVTDGAADRGRTFAFTWVPLAEAHAELGDWAYGLFVFSAP